MTHNVNLILPLLIAIFLAPKNFFIGIMPIRPEDLIAPLIIILSIFLYLKHKNIRMNKISNLFLVYISYTLIITLLNDAIYNQQFYSLILLIKEISFLSIYIYISYLMNIKEFRNNIYKLMLYISVPNVLNGFYQLIYGWKGIYGVSPFGHEDSPLSSGLLYFYIFFISYLYIHKNKIDFTSTTVIFSSFLFVILSGSKTSVLGLFVFIMLEFIRINKFYFYKFVFFIILITFILLFIKFFNFNEFGSLSRYSSGIQSPIDVLLERGIWWKFEWSNNPINLIFGNGLSIGHINHQGDFSFNMAMDNQFLYLIVTVGIIGTVLYLFMIILLIKIFKFKNWCTRIFISLLGSYLAMGLGAEIFHLSLSGSLFWMFCGLLLTQSKFDMNCTQPAVFKRSNGDLPPETYH